MASLFQSAGDVPFPKSQTSLAYARIRTDILTGRFAPNERLKIADLASSFGVSPGAVREALSRLVPEKLVVSQDQKGCVVSPLSIDDLEDLTDFRCEIEAIALRRSVERGEVSWEAGILAAWHQLRRTLQQVAGMETPLAPEWVRLHRAFHAAMVNAAGSSRLLDLHASLYEHSERYRGLSGSLAAGRDVAGEHQALVDAALARDADLLVSLAMAHMRRTTTLIVTAAGLSAKP